MKIDEFIRETMVKMEPAAKGKVEAGISTSPEMSALMAESLPDADFFFPDLLQAFGKLLSRRQELLDVLPQSVQNRLAETSGSSPNSFTHSTASTPNPSATFPQGVSGLARDSRIVTDTLRQMISELEFADRVPALTPIYDDFSAKIDSLLSNRGVFSNQPDSLNGTSQQASVAKTLPELVKATLQEMQSIVTAAKVPTTPTAYFIRHSVQALQAGQLAPAFADWLEEAAATLDQLSGETELEPVFAKGLEQIDPRVLRLAQTLDKPEILRVWAAVQEMTGTSGPTASAPITPASMDFSSISAPVGATVHAQPNNLEFLRTVVAKIADLPVALPVATQNAQPVTTSQVGRFELLLSSVAARPELLEKLMAVLPELMVSGELLQSEKSAQPVYQTLAQTAPKWLKTMAEREQKPALLEFWLAAKVADLAPWVKMEPLERQQLTTVLKELAATFEQPEAFRTPREDTNSRSFMMQVPLYAPGQESPYPALIQVFEEKKERGNGQLPEQEVWVRVSLETDHIGTVDLSFRLQDKKYLSIFSRFANPEAASEFRASLPELRKEMAGTSLELKKIAVAGRIHPGGKGNG